MGNENNYDALKIANQLCFPLYACAKEVVRQYKPYLDPLDLTYTQYITMMVMWEKEEITVKDLGSALYLDSGTLTPLLKKMESKGLIIRTRSKDDERNLNISLTKRGEMLKEDAINVPIQVGKFMNLSKDESITLYGLLYKVLENIDA